MSMFYNYQEDYQYDSCIAKGICSISPRNSSLREVLVMYLKNLAFYTLQLKHLGLKNNSTQKIILNTISSLISNFETENEQFYKILTNLKILILETTFTYKKICKEKNLIPKIISTEIKLHKNLSISKLIRLGEKEFSEKIKLIPENKRNLYEIIFMVIKSIAINIVELNSYNETDDRAYNEILYLLNTLNYPLTETYILKKKIFKAVEVDFCITKRINFIKEKNFGSPQKTEVSYTTRPRKTILVAGMNIQELKKVLDFTEGKEIDVYTHGEMIEAYTYPVFQRYKHLRGQYGKGIESCLLDFATFPGSILIAQHSLETIEYLYRGRLFTTDNFVPKGVVQVIDNDFSSLVESANKSKGFKKGQKKPSIKYGYSNDELLNKLHLLLDNLENYKKVIILPTEINTNLLKIYFDTLLNNIDNETFVISMTEIPNINNSIILNTAPNFFVLYKVLEIILEPIKEYNIDLSVFISKCDKHTISNTINLRKLGVKKVFLSKCTPIMLNPTLTETLKNEFKINPTTEPIKDLEN